jgi:hypothetical protein
MIKNILSVLALLFSIFFFYFVAYSYFSEKHKINVKKNRENLSQSIKKNINDLPILTDDTNNAIEFNSGFETKNNKIKRNFWNLFKKND